MFGDPQSMDIEYGARFSAQLVLSPHTVRPNIGDKLISAGGRAERYLQQHGFGKSEYFLTDIEVVRPVRKTLRVPVLGLRIPYTSRQKVANLHIEDKRKGAYCDSRWLLDCSGKPEDISEDELSALANELGEKFNVEVDLKFDPKPSAQRSSR